MSFVLSPAGLDGETRQPLMWRRVRESEEPLSQTAAVSGYGEKSKPEISF